MTALWSQSSVFFVFFICSWRDFVAVWVEQVSNDFGNSEIIFSNCPPTQGYQTRSKYLGLGNHLLDDRAGSFRIYFFGVGG
jgi:hypothetical protein